MKAITQDRYGSADVLQLRDIEAPTPGAHEVLVRVQAAGIARGVLHVMTGEPYLMRVMGFGLLKPKNPVPGQDVAGTVTATGDGVTRWRAAGSRSPAPEPGGGQPARAPTRSCCRPHVARAARAGLEVHGRRRASGRAGPSNPRSARRDAA